MALGGSGLESSQDHIVNALDPQGFILGSTLFLLYINDLPDDFICHIANCADLICGNN